VGTAALIAIVWAAGLHRDELAGLLLGDFTPTGEDDGDLLIRGKCDKERAAYLGNGAYQASRCALSWKSKKPDGSPGLGLQLLYPQSETGTEPF
jgi:site-specific recombinase XerD